MTAKTTLFIVKCCSLAVDHPSGEGHYIHDGQEKERYSELSLEFMSEESSSDELAVTVHRPEW